MMARSLLTSLKTEISLVQVLISSQDMYIASRLQHITPEARVSPSRMSA